MSAVEITAKIAASDRKTSAYAREPRSLRDDMQTALVRPSSSHRPCLPMLALTHCACRIGSILSRVFDISRTSRHDGTAPPEPVTVATASLLVPAARPQRARA